MRRLLALLVAVLIGAVVFAAPAAAGAPAAVDAPECHGGGLSGGCDLEADPPGGGGTDHVVTPVGGGDAEQWCAYQGRKVLCVTDDGRWDGSGWCKPASPQPPQDDPVWLGNTDGVIVVCTSVTVIDATGIAEPSNISITFWAPTIPGAGPSARELADRAVASMGLHAIQIGIVPESVPGSVGIIGMPTWMWAMNPGESTVGPITRTAAAGGNAVTATASVERIVWTMGDGAVVTCAGPGTPYADSYGKTSSPDCGHTYTKQGRYAVSATSFWTVEWAGMGETGTIPLDFTDSVTITMGEAQVIVQ